jgi:hypothetical protein
MEIEGIVVEIKLMCAYEWHKEILVVGVGSITHKV